MAALVVDTDVVSFQFKRDTRAPLYTRTWPATNGSSLS
jgi:hypothetical protein